MLKRIFISLLFVLVSQLLAGQTSFRESLRKELDSLTDPQKLHKLKTLAQVWYEKDYGRALEVIAYFSEIANQQESDIVKADNKNIQGIFSFRIGLFEDAIKSLKEAKDLYIKNNDPHGVYKTNHNLGYIHTLSKEYSTALRYHRIALNVAKHKLRNVFDQADEMRYLGICYQELEEYDSAYIHFENAQNLFLSIDLPDSAVVCLTGLLEVSLKDRKNEAEKWFRKLEEVEPLCQLEKSHHLIALTRIRYLYQTGQTDEAIVMMTALIRDWGSAINTSGKYLETISWIQQHYKEQNQYELALACQRILRQSREKQYEAEKNKRIISLKSQLYHEEEVVLLQKQKEDKAYLLRKLKMLGRRQFILYLTFSLTLFILIIYVYYFHRRKIRNRKYQETQARLQQLNLQLEASNQQLLLMQHKKSKFLQVASMGLRQPFFKLVEDSKTLVENRFKEKNKTSKSAQHLHNNAEDLFQQLKKLLVWSRIERNRIKIIKDRIQLFDFLSLMITEVKREYAYKKISITLEGDQYARIEFDDYCLKIILKNLLENAIKYSPPENHVDVYIHDAREEVRLVIRDEGIGIAPEIQSELFRMKTHATSPGTSGEKGLGLGLIIAQALADLNNSSLSMKSTPGKGSIFTLHIPK